MIGLGLGDAVGINAGFDLSRLHQELIRMAIAAFVSRNSISAC
jgi:hypothetical protein